MITHRNLNENRALDRLELKIMEHFGRKNHLDIQYIIANETLNEVFSIEERFEQFYQNTLDL